MKQKLRFERDTYGLNFSLPGLGQGEDAIDAESQFSRIQWSPDSGECVLNVDILRLHLGVARELQ